MPAVLMNASFQACTYFQVVTRNCTLYMYSDRTWQQCALFQNATSSFLGRTGYLGSYSSVGQTRMRVIDQWVYESNITDLATNQTGIHSICQSPFHRCCQPLNKA